MYVIKILQHQVYEPRTTSSFKCTKYCDTRYVVQALHHRIREDSIPTSGTWAQRYITLYVIKII